MAERTLRRPKHPGAYAVAAAVAVVVLAASVIGTWSMARTSDPLAGLPIRAGGAPR